MDADVNKRRLYKCFVPLCTNTSFSTPEKYFICVPHNIKRRKKWFRAARRPDIRYSEGFRPRSVIHCCQDHFDMEEDMESFLRFKMMGGLLQSKKHVVPHIFHCRQSHSAVPFQRSLIAKRNAARLLNDAMGSTIATPVSSSGTPTPAGPLYPTWQYTTWARNCKLAMQTSGQFEVVSTDQGHFNSGVKVESPESLADTGSTTSSGIKEEPDDRDVDPAAKSRQIPDETSETADEMRREPRIYRSNPSSDVPWWEVPEPEVDPLLLWDVKPEEQGSCGHFATQAFAEVNMDKGVEQWEVAAECSEGFVSTAVDPLELPEPIKDPTNVVKSKAYNLWMCKKCERTFVSIDDLNQHFTNHNCLVKQLKISKWRADSLYTCNACGKQFNRKVGIAKHLLSLTGAEPEARVEVREVSEEKISRKSDCIIVRKNETNGTVNCDGHMLNSRSIDGCEAAIPSSVSCFVCGVCGQEFAKQVEFKMHLWSHICEYCRVFACDKVKCSEKRARNAQLKKRRRNALLKKRGIIAQLKKRGFTGMHACQQCDYQSKWPGVLENHVLLLHPANENETSDN